MNYVNTVSEGPPENQSLARLRALRAASSPTPPGDVPACYHCHASLSDPGDLLCPPCYASRRAPGRVLPFDPDRRSRTLARLADRPCPDCHTTDWYVSPRGDATCQACARSRAGGAA